ncbi:MAG: hypothetical protein AAGL89_12180 [Pseudomonadota bacterium]
MRAVWVLCALVSASAPAAADERTFEFLGGHGCTVSEDTRDALANAGFLKPYTNAILDDALARGVAERQGDYIVLDDSICTIRLPDIQSRWSVNDPEIEAMAPYIREEYTIGDMTYVDEGCFFRAGMDGFVALNGGDVEAGYRDYMQFMAAAIISGEVRMYSDNPLRTPPGLQLLSGNCADLPNIDDIRRSHDVLVASFGDWVRASQAVSVCGDYREYGDPMFPIRAQGVDPMGDEDAQPAINALLGIEWMLITVGAGWRDGDRSDDKGVARPPLCHVE